MSEATHSAGPISWAETRRRLARDRERVRAMVGRRFARAPGWMVLHHSYLCALLQRLAHYSLRRGSGKFARLFTQMNSLLTGADFHPASDLGAGLLVVHPTATTCSGKAGEDFTMFPLCGIGMLPRDKDVGAGPGLPLLGDGVWMGPGTGVLGPVLVGSGTRIQPGAGATHDTPAQALIEVATAPQPAAGAHAARASTVDATDAPCPHAQWSATRKAIGADIDRHLRERGAERSGIARDIGAIVSHELATVFVHRIAHWLHACGWELAANGIAHLNFFVFRSAISPASCIGDGAFIPHSAGLVFHGRAGREVTMYARTVCAARHPTPYAPIGEAPLLGERVVFAGMAAILGPVKVGDDVRLSFNAQVEDDVAGPCALASRVRFHAVEPARPAPTAEDMPPVGKSVSQLIDEDRAALERVCGGRALPAARLCTWLFRRAADMRRRSHHRASWWLWRLNVALTGADIDPRSSIDGGLAIPHPVGISLHVTAGRNLTVRALAGAGGETALASDPWAFGERPVIGNDVEICEHASVHGPVRIGDRVRLGPGCKVMRDVAAGQSLEVPAPRRIAPAGGS